MQTAQNEAQFQTLLLEIDGPVATLTVNRPKVLNALSELVLDELLQAIGRIAQDASVRALIVTGAGEKAFVAGADIAAMEKLEPAQALRLAGKGHQVGDALAALAQPVIAAVNGFALGGGLELAMACDVIYASTNARFGQPEVNIGVMPGFGGSQRLPRRVPFGVAAELLLGGDPITAEEALRIGLVNKVLPQAELLPEARKLAHKIASRAPLAVMRTKRALHAALELPLKAGNELERRLFSELFATADQKEGMGAFLAKRPPGYKGE
ncbi:MAG: enoyl-CoA hydratase-related protein [Polyangia bacterium]